MANVLSVKPLSPRSSVEGSCTAHVMCLIGIDTQPLACQGICRCLLALSPDRDDAHSPGTYCTTAVSLLTASKACMGDNKTAAWRPIMMLRQPVPWVVPMSNAHRPKLAKSHVTMGKDSRCQCRRRS